MSDEDKRKLDEMSLIMGQRAVIDLLFILLRNRPPNGYPKDLTIPELLDQARIGVLPIVNDAQQATLDTAKAAFTESIIAARDELKKQVKQKLVDANRSHRQVVAVNRITSPGQVQERKEEKKSQFLRYLPIIMASVADVFERNFTTALTNTINDVVLDNATSSTLFTGEDPKEVLVYKEVINDGSLCQWCKRFYVKPDGSPVVFKLAELQANGSNYGKKKRDWKPTVGSTHPRCRCQLHHGIPPKKNL
jgi:hypothetical protein